MEISGSTVQKSLSRNTFDYEVEVECKKIVGTPKTLSGETVGGVHASLQDDMAPMVAEYGGSVAHDLAMSV